MIGMLLLLCCSLVVLCFLSVQAYENLALHQLVWQSSTWLSDTGAQRAVDGRYTGRCAESFNNPTAEWRVDLTGVKNIHHVFIQHATGIWWNWDFLGFSVFISNTTNKEDGTLCFRDTYHTYHTRATITNPINITCLCHGRYVIYYNNRTHPPYPVGYSRYTRIGLCEVEVYGCRSLGKYGENCSLECPQNCQNGYCDIVEGTCLACKPGFKGPQCIGKSPLYIKI
ncbi:uncharacterized protein LOC111113881 [Crassostrea virginica]